MDQWIEEVASEIEQGLDDAGRFDPATRHMRGVLAFAHLDHVARNWAQGRDRAELDPQMFDPSGGRSAGGSGDPPSPSAFGQASPRVYAVMDSDP